MSGGGSYSKSKSSSQQAAAPWIGQQPFLTDLWSQAQGVYNQGTPGYYPGSTYAPFNDLQQGAMGGMVDRSGGSPQESQFGDYISQQVMQPNFNLGGAGYGANQAIGGVGAGMQGLTTQSNPFGQSGFDAQNYVREQMMQNPTLGGSINQVNQHMDPYAMNALRQSASGDLINSNPYLDKQYEAATRNVREQFNDTVMPGINATFGGAGRTGSGLHQASVGQAGADLGRTLGDLATNMYGGAYGQERERQMGAANSLGGFNTANAGIGAGAYANDAGRRLSAAGLGGDLYGGGAGRQLQGYQSLLSGGLQGIDSLGGLYNNVQRGQQFGASNVPTLAGLQWGNLDRLAGVGQNVQDLTQRGIDDDRSRYDYYAQGPQNNLSNYAAIILQQLANQSNSKSKASSMSMSGSVGAT